MQKRRNGSKPDVPVWCGGVAAAAALLLLLLAAAALVQRGALPKPLELPLTAACCLFSTLPGVMLVGKRQRQRGLALGLTSAVPAVLLLCCGIGAAGEAGLGGSCLLSMVLLLPWPMLSFLGGGKRHRKSGNYRSYRR